MNGEWQYDQHSQVENLYHSLNEAYEDIDKLRAENAELRELARAAHCHAWMVSDNSDYEKDIWEQWSEQHKILSEN